MTTTRIPSKSKFAGRTGALTKSAILVLLAAPAITFLAGTASAAEPTPSSASQPVDQAAHLIYLPPHCNWLRTPTDAADLVPRPDPWLQPCTPEPGCGPVSSASLWFWCPPVPVVPPTPKPPVCGPSPTALIPRCPIGTPINLPYTDHLL